MYRVEHSRCLLLLNPSTPIPSTLKRPLPSSVNPKRQNIASLLSGKLTHGISALLPTLLEALFDALLEALLPAPKAPFAKASAALLCAALILTVTGAPYCLAADQIKDVFKQADSAEIQGNEAEALKIYTNLIESLKKSDQNNPKLARAEARIARLHLLNNQYDKATPFYDKLLKTYHERAAEDPELMVDLDDLSNVYLKFKDDKTHDIDCLQRSLKIREFINHKHPHLPENYRLLSTCMLNRNDFPSAISWIGKAIAVDRTYPRQKLDRLVHDLTIQGTIHIRAKNFKAAQASFVDSLNVGKQSGCADSLIAQCYLHLGYCLMMQKRFDEADENYKLALIKLKDCPAKLQYLKLLLAGHMKENELQRNQARKNNGKGKA